ncbi:MAG: ATP-binding protein [Candidatus Pacebacteria bacterium]|nr:ATP-binding protein [Candidatus Paceibacterota bacterium]
MQRLQIKQIEKDLNKKMVFIVGPRQVGKTWLAKEIAKKHENSVYLNYDNLEDKEIIEKKQWPVETELLILDEIHKKKDWKNYLKGLFDTKSSNLKILVTGSARLETFRQSGDSLAGRFFVHRLMPFSLSEIKQVSSNNSLYGIDRYLERSGFPEPFLAENNIEADRWRHQYIDGLIRNDILDFENIHDFQAIKMVFELLRRKVGSPISYQSIARDVKVSPKTVKKYIDIFEALFIVFKVKPYSHKISRAIIKEPKIYFYDTGLLVADEGIKFENFVAVSLLKSVLYENDVLGKAKVLSYLKTKEGKEVDFVISENSKLDKIIEVKLSSDQVSKNLQYFTKKYNLAGVQIVKNIRQEKHVLGLKIVKAEKFLSSLAI